MEKVLRVCTYVPKSTEKRLLYHSFDKADNMPDDVWAQGFPSLLVINNMSNAMSKNAHFQGD